MRHTQWKRSSIYFLSSPDPMHLAARDTNLPDFGYVVLDMGLIPSAGGLTAFVH